MTIGYNGEVYRPVYTQQGMVLVLEESFGPVRNSEKTHELYSRKIGENIWILVKNGYILQATIGRAVVCADDFVSCMQDVSRHVFREAEKQREKEKEKNGEQQM